MPSSPPPVTRLLLPCTGGIPPYLTPILFSLFKGRNLCLSVDACNSCVHFEDAAASSGRGEDAADTRKETVFETSETSSSSSSSSAESTTTETSATTAPAVTSVAVHSSGNPLYGHKRVKKAQKADGSSRGYTFVGRCLKAYHRLPVDDFPILVTVAYNVNESNSSIVQSSGCKTMGLAAHSVTSSESDTTTKTITSTATAPSPLPPSSSLSLQTTCNGRQVLSLSSYVSCVSALVASLPSPHPSNLGVVALHRPLFGPERPQKRKECSTAEPRDKDDETKCDAAHQHPPLPPPATAGGDVRYRKYDAALSNRTASLLPASLDALSSALSSNESDEQKQKQQQQCVWSTVAIDPSCPSNTAASLACSTAVLGRLKGVLFLLPPSLTPREESSALQLLQSSLSSLSSSFASSSAASSPLPPLTAFGIDPPPHPVLSLLSFVTAGLHGVNFLGAGLAIHLAKVGCSLAVRPSSASSSDPSYQRDLRSAEYRLDTNPLQPGCKCMACQRHSRAYVHHLLNVSELLGEILLFVHNLWQLCDLVDDVNDARGDELRERNLIKRFE